MEECKESKQINKGMKGERMRRKEWRKDGRKVGRKEALSWNKWKRRQWRMEERETESWMYRWSYSQWIVAAGFSIWGFSHDAKTARPIRAQPCTIQSACRAALPGPPLPARRLLCLCLPRSLSKPLFYQQPFSSIITAVEFQGVMGQSRSILLCISCFYKNYRTDLNTKKGE